MSGVPRCQEGMGGLLNSSLWNSYGSCLDFIFYVFILPMLAWSSFLLKKYWLIHSNFDSHLSKTKATPCSLWIEMKSSLQLLWPITPWASKAHHPCLCSLGPIPYLGLISQSHPYETSPNTGSASKKHLFFNKLLVSLKHSFSLKPDSDFMCNST